MTRMEWLGEIDNSILKLFGYIFNHAQNTYPESDLEVLAEITVYSVLDVVVEHLTPQQQKIFYTELRNNLTKLESLIDKE